MRHWIPPLVTSKIALSTARIHSVRGRPPLVAAGIRSLIHSHSSLVRSLGYIFSFIHLFYTTNEGFSDRLSEKCLGRGLLFLFGTPNKLIIAGLRTFTDYQLLCHTLPLPPSHFTHFLTAP